MPAIFAQTVDWSEPQKVKDKMVYSEVIGADNGNYFIIRYNKKAKQQFIIEKFNNKLALSKKFEFEVSKDVSVEKIMLLEGKIYIFSDVYDIENKRHQLLVNIYNENFNPVLSDKLLITSNFKYSNRKSYHIAKDMINNRILVVYPENTIDNKLVFRVSVFNAQLEQTFINSFGIDNEKFNYQLEQFLLIDSTVAVVYRIFKGNADEPSNLKFYLVDFDLQRNKQTLYKFADDSLNFNNVIIKYDIPNRTLIAAGYYSYINSDYSEGIAFLKIFKNKDSALYRNVIFPQELKNSLLGRSNKKDKINSFYPKGIIIRDDGGFLFIGEYYWLQKETYNDYYTFSTTYVKYYFHYGNAMLLSIDPEGTVDWHKVIRKEQVSMSDEGYYSSIITATTSNKIALLYNDISRTRTNLVYNTIEPDNTINNYILVNGNSFDGALIPKLGKQVTLNEIIIPGFENKKGFVFIRIKV